MSEFWQLYQKVGSRWEAILQPITKDEAEAWVVLMRHKLKAFEKAAEDAKKAGRKNNHPDPGFREPHCVPV